MCWGLQVSFQRDSARGRRLYYSKKLGVFCPPWPFNWFWDQGKRSKSGVLGMLVYVNQGS